MASATTLITTESEGSMDILFLAKLILGLLLLAVPVMLVYRAVRQIQRDEQIHEEYNSFQPGVIHQTTVKLPKVKRNQPIEETLTLTYQQKKEMIEKIRKMLKRPD